MSDENTPDETADSVVGPGELQRVAKIRDWRQRYAGPDGEYVYRRMIKVRGPRGVLRRVQGGERVDCEADGITPRRLKALWYSSMIELADKTAILRAPMRKGITNNRALREDEAKKQAQEEQAVKDRRKLRHDLNEQLREETRQRRLAERAVRAAEDAELREIEDIIKNDDLAAHNARVQEMLDNRTKVAAEEAALDKELADEQAQIQRDRLDDARERAAEASEKAAGERAAREAATMERIQARAATEALKHGPPREESTQAPNPDNQSVSAEEAKAALDDL